ncbi:MAG: hypothetical protein RLZZ337_1003 [Bacteroidota bacterium]|jgi:uncharacterized repeat protein (TIGR01451 family)
MKFILTSVLTISLLMSFGQLPIHNTENLIRRHIDNVLKKENHQIEYVLKSSTINIDHVSHYYGIQILNGKQIVGTEFNISVSANEIVNFHHAFIVNPEKLVKINVYNTSAREILQYLVGDFPILKEEVVWDENEKCYSYVNQILSDEPIRIYKKWFLLNDEIRPVYEVSLYEKNHLHWFNTIIDATTRVELKKTDWVLHCNTTKDIFSNQNRAPIMPQEDQVSKAQASSGYRVFALPLESPNHGNRTLEEDPHNTDASPYGWHDINGQTGPEFTITRGNNVFASEDKNADNIAGYSPNGGSDLLFDYEFDITKSAALYTDASITNLFYWNNVMHDVWWHYGFDDQSGNFQQNNYGRGGIGGDFVNADAQDGSGTNNANFATPPDGQNPRMQMYIWNASNSGDYFQVNSPSFAAGKYLSNVAGFGSTLTTTPLTANVVAANSGGTDNSGCTAIQNASAINGKIALIQRGGCTFVEKVKNAQNAGAIGVIIYNNVTTNPTRMGGTDNSINIPSVMIKKTDGEYILGLLSTQTVNVSLYDSSLTADNTFDSDFDNGVIAHEYGHGISVRLTGGAANSGCLSNEEQMGEGWSDFFALVMTHQPGDQPEDERGIGTYVSNEETNGDGIRVYPYSTNLSKSPYTYDNIKSFSVPHGVGSVWCSMLWDLYWSFIDEYGYDDDIYEGTGGNNMAMQLVIDGLKLQPCGPGFADGRDAILLADRLRYNGANQKMIWEVFARRGLGYDASQGSSNSRSDGTSAFNLPPFLRGELIIEKIAPSLSNNNEDLSYKIKITNLNETAVTNIFLSDTLDSEVVLKEETLDCNAIFNNGIITINLDSISARDSFVCTYTVTPKLAKTGTIIWSDDVEQGEMNWTKTRITGNNGWTISTTRKKSGTSSWFVQNEGSQSDYYLSGPIEVSGFAPALSFWHWYNSEELWDGGLIEYKTATSTWTDVEPLFMLNGYNATIQTNPQSTISDRKAFTGNSQKFINTKINLSDFVGTTIEIRFRFASDGAAAEEGWYIDDIALEDVAYVENMVHANYSNDKNGNAGTLTFIQGESVSASISQLYSDEIVTVFPNPTDGIVTISGSSTEKITVNVYDVHGKMLQEIEGYESVTSDLSGYLSGIYILEINTGNNVIRRRIVKE